MTTEPTKAAPPSPETVVYAPAEAVASTVDEPLISPEIGQQVRTACLVVLALCVTGAALSQLGPILTPLLIALFLYFLFRPLAGFIPRLRISRWVAYPALFVAMLVAVQVVGEMVQSNARALEAKLPEYRDKLRGVIEIAARRLGHADPDGNYDWERALQDELARFKLRDVVSTTLGLVETTAMTLFYLFFISIEAHKLPVRIRKAYSTERADQLLLVSHQVNEGMNRYLTVKTGVSFGLGATAGLLGYFFGLDFWMLWGLLMFFSNYITYIGSIVGLIPPVALAFVQFSNPWAATTLALLLVAARVFWIDYVEIALSGKHLNVSPLVLLLSLAFFGWLWGVVGLLLAVPLVTAVKIVLLSVQRTRHFGILLSED